MSTPATTTQARRPWRAAVRTGFQTALWLIPSLGYIVPEIVAIILEETGEAMPDVVRVVLLAAAAFVVVAATITARIMALPGVEDFLRRHMLVRGLAADPPSAPVKEHRLFEYDQPDLTDDDETEG